MVSTVAYVSATIALTIVSGILLVVAKNSANPSQIRPTPSIPAENAVVTAFASTRIRATADDVFAAMLENFKGGSYWSLFTEYQWKDKDLDGLPIAGTTGSVRVSMFRLSHTLKIRLGFYIFFPHVMTR